MGCKGVYITRTCYHDVPMQHTAIFTAEKNDNLALKMFYYFLMFAQNVDCGYTLEPPRVVLSPITIDVLFLNQQKWKKNSSKKNVSCARVDELEL